MKGTEHPAEATHPLELFESYIDHTCFNHHCIIQHVLLTPAHMQTLIYPAFVSSENESFQNYNCPCVRLPQ